MSKFVLQSIPGGRWQRIRDLITSAEDGKRPLTRDEFGQVLRDARVLAGLSLGDLSEMLGTSPAKLAWLFRKAR